MTWTAATDFGGSGIKDYVVYRGGVAVATVTTTSHTDTGLIASTLYSFQISARDTANNESTRTAAVTATTLDMPDTTPPSVPGTLAAVAVSASRINLSWGAATDDIGVTRYRVERCAGAGCTTFAQIATPTAPASAIRGSRSRRRSVDRRRVRGGVLMLFALLLCAALGAVTATSPSGAPRSAPASSA